MPRIPESSEKHLKGLERLKATEQSDQRPTLQFFKDNSRPRGHLSNLESSERRNMQTKAPYRDQKKKKKKEEGNLRIQTLNPKETRFAKKFDTKVFIPKKIQKSNKKIMKENNFKSI